MCTISEKLKLCTCEKKDIAKLMHHWKLKRPKPTGKVIEGNLLLPADLGKSINKHNHQTILHQLNTGNCFDFEITPKENDQLELFFTLIDRPQSDFNIQEGNFLIYEFKFKNEKWIKEKHNLFNNDFKCIQTGEIKFPFIN